MLELNKITCGNSLDLLKQVDDNSIQLHLHSPPYATMKNYGECKGIPADDYVNWYLPFAVEIYRTLHKNGSFILNINDKVESGFRHNYVYELVYKLTKDIGFNLYERLFWNKGKSLCHPKRFRDSIEYLFWFTKSDKFYFNIDSMRVPYNPISINRMKNPIKKRFNRTLDNQEKQEYKEWKPNPLGALPSTLVSIGSESKRISNINFAVYPEKLVNYFIKGSTRPKDIVCDIFSGSGTTCVAAKKLDRQFLGFELELAAYEESLKRLSDL
jgi:DNA modification methylase